MLQNVEQPGYRLLAGSAIADASIKQIDSSGGLGEGHPGPMVNHDALIDLTSKVSL